MTTGQQSVLFSLVGVLGGFAIGILFNLRVNPDQPDFAVDIGSIKSIALDLSNELRLLREEHSRVLNRPTMPGGALGAQPMVSPQLEELSARIGTMEGELRQLGEHVSVVGELVAKLLGSESLAAAYLAQSEAGDTDALPDVIPEVPMQVQRLLALDGKSFEELGGMFLLWTYNQVLEEYGKPTRIAPAPNGVGIRFYYALPNGKEFIFWFIKGKGVKAFWD